MAVKDQKSEPEKIKNAPTVTTLAGRDVLPILFSPLDHLQQHSGHCRESN